MAKISIQSEVDTPAVERYQAPVSVDGGCWSKVLIPTDFPLWLVLAELEDGARIVWPKEHGDEGVYVIEGALQVGDVQCRPGGAVILEAGSDAIAKASGRTRVVHCGGRAGSSPGEVEKEIPLVHVVGPDGWFLHHTPRGSRVVWYADSTCPTCDIMLLRVQRSGGAEDRGIPHTHSRDEIVYVLEGEISMGSQRCPAGHAIAIPADVRYAFTKSVDGFVFLNYRAGPSVQTWFPRDAAPKVEEEAALVRGGVLVGDVHNVEGVAS